MSTARYSFAACIVVFALAACGGGGGDGTGTGTGTGTGGSTGGVSPEGGYGGSLTGSPVATAFRLLVLENNEIWALYGNETPSFFAVRGFLQGQGSATATTFSSSDIRDFGVVPVSVGSASATYDSVARTVSGTVTFPSGTVGLSGGPVPGSLYLYNIAASLTTIAGSWTLTELSGETISLSIQASGAFTATSSGGCSFSGNFSPRPSGRNVFNAQVLFGPAPCLLANQSANGSALAFPLGSGLTQFIFAGTNIGRTVGAAAFGVR